MTPTSTRLTRRDAFSRTGWLHFYQDVSYKMFRRLDPRRGAGEGLGLTIVCRLLERHGGKIWVESEPNKGSTFYMSLPNG